MATQHERSSEERPFYSGIYTVKYPPTISIKSPVSIPPFLESWYLQTQPTLYTP